MKTFIDVQSLSFVPLPKPVADALTALVESEYKGQEILHVQPYDRMRILGQLVEGAGVRVVCGPSLLPFWSAVSIEVGLYVQPDGYQSRRRTNGMEWALEAQGLHATVAANLAKNPPKLESHQYMPMYQAAQRMLAQRHQFVLAPIVEGRVPVTILKGTEALSFLRNQQQRSDDSPIALDFEYDPETHEPDGLNIAYDAVIGGFNLRTLAYVPFRASDYTAPDGFAKAVLEEVERLHDRKVHSVYHNGKSDLAFVAEVTGRNPIRMPSNIHDTIVMAYVAGYTELGLKELTPELLGREAMGYPGALSKLSVALAAQYGGAGDANNTLDLYHALRKKLVEQEQWDVYTRIEQPLVPLVASMEWAGQPLSVTALYHAKSQLELTMAGLVQHVWAKERLDLRSDKDQLTFVTRKLGYNPGTLSNDVLSTKSEEAWMDTLIGFRKLRHRYRAFIVKHIARWKAQGYPDNFRAYSSFNQAGSADETDERSFKRAPRTGRFSSSAQKRGKVILGDNLQNQPEVMRPCYVAPPGCEVWSRDHSALEMRIAAGVSRDPAMLAVLTEVCPDGECGHLPKHGDPHGQFQYKAWEITGIDVGRTVAKNFNFGMNYNAGAETQQKSLAKARAFITLEVSRLLYNSHHEIYSGYHAYNEAQQALAEKQGYSSTLFGRRRYDPDLASPDNQVRSHARRAAGNMGVQGTAADFLKIEMGEVISILMKYDAQLSIQVHDELVGWVPKVNAPAFYAELDAIMSSHDVNGLPLPVSGGSGPSWADAH